jgi:hypothetical protein
MLLVEKILLGFVIYFLILSIITVVWPINYYKKGVDYYRKQNYPAALKFFKKVSPSDENYAASVVKIKEIKPIVDSLNKAFNTKGKPVKQNSISNVYETLVAPGKTYHLGALSYKLDRYTFKESVGGVYMARKVDDVFLIVRLRVTNEGRQQLIVDDSFFKLVDDNEVQYQYSPEATAAIDQLEFLGQTFLGAALNPQTTKKVKLVFEVPARKKVYRLVFNDWISDNKLVLNLSAY